MVDVNRLFGEVTERDLDELLRAGEGQQIEFKETLPSILDLAKNVAALANAQGGVIIVGARESKPQIAYGGHDSRVDQFFDDLGKRIRPCPEIRMHRVNYRGAIVPVIVVKPHPAEVVVSDAGAFIRDGEKNRPMTAIEIQAKLPTTDDPLTKQHFAEGIASVSKALADVQEQFQYSQTVRGQLQTYFIGFVLGIVASVIASFIYVAIVGK